MADALAAVSEGRPAAAGAIAALTELQYEIFRQRRDSPPVVNWFYSRHREEDERAMRTLASSRVAEYQSAMAKVGESTAVQA